MSIQAGLELVQRRGKDDGRGKSIPIIDDPHTEGASSNSCLCLRLAQFQWITPCSGVDSGREKVISPQVYARIQDLMGNDHIAPASFIVHGG